MDAVRPEHEQRGRDANRARVVAEEAREQHAVDQEAEEDREREELDADRLGGELRGLDGHLGDRAEHVVERRVVAVRHAPGSPFFAGGISVVLEDVADVLVELLRPVVVALPRPRVAQVEVVDDEAAKQDRRRPSIEAQAAEERTGQHQRHGRVDHDARFGAQVRGAPRRPRTRRRARAARGRGRSAGGLRGCETSRVPWTRTARIARTRGGGARFEIRQTASHRA